MSESRPSLLGTQASNFARRSRDFGGPRLFARWLRLAGGLALSTLREIFDESAYARFLGKNNLRSCPGAYGLFLREQESIKARRPKCC